MKNARIGLLVLSVFAFQNTDAKSDKKQQAQQKQAAAKRQATARKAAPVRKGAAPVVVEQDSHKVEVSERPMQRNERVAPSQETNVSENQETGLVTEVTTTVTPMPQENKVVTTTETRTWTDTAITAGKYALGAAAVAGAGYLAYQNHEGFRNGVDNSMTYGGEQYGKMKESAGNMYESAGKKFGEFEKSASERLGNLRESTSEGFAHLKKSANDRIVSSQERFNNWRSGTVAPASTAATAQELGQKKEALPSSGSFPLFGDVEKENQSISDAQSVEPETSDNSRSINDYFYMD